MKTDQLLQTDVTAELAWNTAVDHRPGIGFSVKDGVVTLSGDADTFMQKYAVERAGRRVAGVRGIAMDLEVRLSGGAKTIDADIAHATLNALRWHSLVPDERVTVEVDDGHVTLDGELDWACQVASAQQCVRPPLGAKGLTSNLRTRPHVSSTDIAGGIVAALQRHAQREAKNSAIQVDGGVVILSGKVDCLREREAAVGTALSAKGVVRVVDQLQVAAAPCHASSCKAGAGPEAVQCTSS